MGMQLEVFPLNEKINTIDVKPYQAGLYCYVIFNNTQSLGTYKIIVR